MAGVIVSIGGATIKKQPDDLGFEWYDLTKSGRVASGKMMIDIIAKKRKFTLMYEVISGPNMETLLTIINGDNPFFELVYIQNGVQKTCTVYSGAKKGKRFRTDGVWYWKNFSFDLIEQ